MAVLWPLSYKGIGYTGSWHGVEPPHRPMCDGSYTRSNTSNSARATPPSARSRTGLRASTRPSSPLHVLTARGGTTLVPKAYARSRTVDPRFTKAVLWPSELRRQDRAVLREPPVGLEPTVPSLQVRCLTSSASEARLPGLRDRLARPQRAARNLVQSQVGGSTSLRHTRCVTTVRLVAPVGVEPTTSRL